MDLTGWAAISVNDPKHIMCNMSAYNVYTASTLNINTIWWLVSD
jgi:hypothetical protein